MLTKLLVFHLAKLGIIGSIGVFLLTEEAALGLPHGVVLLSLLANVYWFGWESSRFCSCYVGGMVPPDENSSNAYIHWFHSLHLYFNRAPTAKDMLKIITR